MRHNIFALVRILLIVRTLLGVCNASVPSIDVINNNISSRQLRPNSDAYANPLSSLWINLDHSVLRSMRMESMFESLEKAHKNALLPIRISAVNKQKVDALKLAGHLETVGTSLLDNYDENVANWEHHFRGEYLKSEAGCVLSHLFAIKEAYNRGDEVALVLEDDVVIPDKLILNWKTFLSLAPPGWEVIQLFSNNEVIMQLTGRMTSDGFMPWMPDHYCTAAYFINRAGMKTLLDLTHKDGIHWILPDKIVVADELLYYYTASYTALDPMVYITVASSTIQADSEEALNARAKLSHDMFDLRLASSFVEAPVLAPDAPRVLIITTTMIIHENQTQPSIDRFFSNVAVISKYVRVRYELLVLCRSDSMKQPLIEAAKPYLKMYGNYVMVHFKIQHRRYNKFRFVRKFVREMGRYDQVLLVDSDIIFAGFPWGEFFQRHRDTKAVITSTVRESKSEGLIQNIHPGVRQWFKVFDGSWWKRPENQHIDFVYTDFLEQYLAIMDGQFAQWYFHQILTDEILQESVGVFSESDFGPDVMWCGAAHEWLNRTENEYFYNPCVLFPIVITHADTRQITFSGGDSDKNHLNKQVSRFPGWSEYSYKFRNVLGGKRWQNMNMSAAIYQYSGYSASMLAIIGMDLRRGSYYKKVVKRKVVRRRRSPSNSTNSTIYDQQF